MFQQFLGAVPSTAYLFLYPCSSLFLAFLYPSNIILMNYLYEKCNIIE
jgi:hypothetical protein